jgi:hypothetical protein
MPTKPTPFLHPNRLREPELLATRHSRVIFCVGGDRFAIDFTSTVTELKPQPADVIPIKRNASAKRRPLGSDRQNRTSSLTGEPLTRSGPVHSFGHPNDFLSPRPLTDEGQQTARRSAEEAQRPGDHARTSHLQSMFDTGRIRSMGPVSLLKAKISGCDLGVN